ncbi:hypothetical protein HAL_40250 [Haladaptatus sp. T7]|nr:hypothetical protein HAL_40250 [Haladaptatus sp. T7]
MSLGSSFRVGRFLFLQPFLCLPTESDGEPKQTDDDHYPAENDDEKGQQSTAEAVLEVSELPNLKDSKREEDGNGGQQLSDPSSVEVRPHADM